jgi:polyphosphate kinase 2
LKTSVFNKETYKKELRNLQIQLVKLQRHIIEHRHKILVILEGRDASGKDGVIKRITQHLSPRETRTVALGKPTERETNAWYFQRYVAHLPAEAEMVLFNRSWYNRAGVERVMGFCSEAEYDEFMNTVNDFETLLVNSGINLIKYYLDISKDEQKRRLQNRKNDPLTQWKISPIDDLAIAHWDDYTLARDIMLEHTSLDSSPWMIVNANDKKRARLDIIKDLLGRVECPDKDEHYCQADKKIVFLYGKENHQLYS